MTLDRTTGSGHLTTPEDRPSIHDSDFAGKAPPLRKPFTRSPFCQGMKCVYVSRRTEFIPFSTGSVSMLNGMNSVLRDMFDFRATAFSLECLHSKENIREPENACHVE